jgi:hypothetical protein
MIKRFDFRYNRESDKLLLLLISTDLLFVLLHIMHTHSPFFNHRYWNIAIDRGFAESFQYVKEFWVVLMFFILAVRKRRSFYLSWSLFFGYLLLDDSFKIHERLGKKISNYFHFVPTFGLRSQDFGELSVSIIFGSILLIFIVISYYYASKDEKNLAKHIMLMIIILCFFGIFFDMIASIIMNYTQSRLIQTILIILEDSGEMIVMSVIVWFVFRLKFMNANKFNSY